MKKAYIAALVVLAALSSSGEDLFVSSSGSGSQDGLSWATSWSYVNFNNATNWAAGAGKISAGDDVYFSGGASGEEYSGQLTFRASGSAGSRITLKPGAAHATLSAGHDGKVTISGMVENPNYTYVGIDGSWSGFPNVTTADEAGNLDASDYKWKVSNTNGQGIHFTTSHTRWVAIEISGCTSGIAGNHAIYSNPNTGQEPVGTLISKCLLQDNDGDGINNTRSNASSATNQVVQFCHIVGNLQDGIQAAAGMTVEYSYLNGTETGLGEHGDGWQAASGGHIIANGNIWRNWPQTILIESSGPDADMSEIRVYNNRMFYDGDFGYMAGLLMSMKYTADNVVVGLTNLLVANNTIFGLTNRSQFKIGANQVNPTTNGTTRFRGCRVENNIFYNADPTQLPILVENFDISSDADITIRNNVVFGNTAITVDGVAYANVAALEAAWPTFTGNTEGEPIFTQTPPAAWGLSESDTVAKGNGLDLSAYFTTDAAGSTRVVPWEIGAYEYLGRRATAGTVNVGTLIITP